MSINKVAFDGDVDTPCTPKTKYKKTKKIDREVIHKLLAEFKANKTKERKKQSSIKFRIEENDDD